MKKLNLNKKSVTGIVGVLSLGMVLSVLYIYQDANIPSDCKTVKKYDSYEQFIEEYDEQAQSPEGHCELIPADHLIRKDNIDRVNIKDSIDSVELSKDLEVDEQ